MSAPTITLPSDDDVGNNGTTQIVTIPDLAAAVAYADTFTQRDTYSGSPRPTPATARYERGTDKVWIYTLSLDGRTLGSLYHWKAGLLPWCLTTAQHRRISYAPRWATIEAALAAIGAYWPTRPDAGARAIEQLDERDWAALCGQAVTV